MKVNIEMDMTPQEARAFMGLPDVAPMQKKMLEEMQARMKAGLRRQRPGRHDAGLDAAWAGAEAFQKFQKADVGQAPPAMVKKDGK